MPPNLGGFFMVRSYYCSECQGDYFDFERILSFRMHGVEFDNGDMYVDAHKAASDVRDQFVSVTEKLMDELAQCYNVLPQLDINNTIDHRPEGDEKWFL